MENPHIINIPSLSNADWCDNDVIMLHACFRLLEDCIKNENLLTGNTDWEHDEEHRSAKAEIETLYNWWQERRVVDDSHLFFATGKKQYEKDDEMLTRLIKVRRYLWT